MMHRHSCRRHAGGPGTWFGNRWFRRGLLLLVLPFGAAACHGRHGRADMTEAEARERASDHLDDVMDWLDANPTQKGQIKQVVDAAIPDLFAYREQHHALRADIQSELEKPTVDPAALEGLRQRALALVDAASARGMQALSDVSQVLTPEQRQKLIAKWKKRSG